MKLVRYGERGAEKPGILDAEGKIRDLSSVIKDVDGSTLGKAQLDRLRSLDLSRLPLVAADVRLGACVGNVPNLVCIGLNYSDHAEETNTPLPKQPIVFHKHTGCISGPNDPVVIPTDSKKLDWEVELAIVIGRHCWHVGEAEAMEYVAGYCIANDVSERAYQLEMDGQWNKGKSYFSFCPLGPWLVTADEIPDPQQMDLSLDVSGTRRQTGNTRTMIFGVKTIISYVSRFMALLPGDVIITGTPPGVGLGHRPPLFLKAGDTMILRAQGMGEQHQKVIAYESGMSQAWGKIAG